MVFLAESWFWRGTQSAIFYYAACTPWVEYKHNRKRRKAAGQSRKDKEQHVVDEQPGLTRQPAPFQTNEDWTQEIVQGPGPPKGWKRDSLYYRHIKAKKREKEDITKTRSRAETNTSTDSPAKSDWSAVASSSTAVGSLPPLPPVHLQSLGATRCPFRAADDTIDAEHESSADPGSGLSTNGADTAGRQNLDTAVSGRPSSSHSHSSQVQALSLHKSSASSSRRSSFASDDLQTKEERAHRPSMEKRLSFAMDGLRDAVRAALHPDQWNWIRYDRDDEFLSGLNDRVKGVWDSMKEHMTLTSEELASKLKQLQMVETSKESEAELWQRGTHPALNDLHPPVVSQLPYTREEATWITLPPASADVMMGRARPDPFKDVKRQPLCVLGRPQTEEAQDERSQGRPASSNGELPAESSAGGGKDLPAGWAHVQKPQRPHLWQHRASNLF